MEEHVGVGRSHMFDRQFSKVIQVVVSPSLVFSHESNRDIVLYDDQACDRNNRNFSLLSYRRQTPASFLARHCERESNLLLCNIWLSFTVQRLPKVVSYYLEKHPYEF